MSRENHKTNSTAEPEGLELDTYSLQEVIGSKIKSIDEEISLLISKKQVLTVEQEKLKKKVSRAHQDKLFMSKEIKPEEDSKAAPQRGCDGLGLEWVQKLESPANSLRSSKTQKKSRLNARERKLLTDSEWRRDSSISNAIGLLIFGVIALMLGLGGWLSISNPSSTLIMERLIIMEIFLGLLIVLFIRNLMCLRKVEKIIKEQAGHREVQCDIRKTIRKTIMGNMLKNKSSIKVR